MLKIKIFALRVLITIAFLVTFVPDMLVGFWNAPPKRWFAVIRSQFGELRQYWRLIPKQFDHSGALIKG